jgi:gluconolactonase
MLHRIFSCALALGCSALISAADSSAVSTISTLKPLDQAAFAKVVAADATLRKLAGDMKFTEGPAWTNANGGYLIFSDIPANQIKKWTAVDGLSVFREPSNRTNGHQFDAEGRLVSCHHDSRCISRTNLDGSVEILVARYDGKKINSPNDLTITKAGIIYFTDPTYGIKKDPKLQEQAGQFVFRFNPIDKSISPVIKDLDMPNGIAFSPDEKLLYVADSGKNKAIYVYDVNGDGTLNNGRQFAPFDVGIPDGIRVDADGRVWSSAGDGVRIFMPDGKHIGTILTPVLADGKPEAPANLCFGGADGKTLFITARKSLYAIDVLVKNAH